MSATSALAVNLHTPPQMLAALRSGPTIEITAAVPMSKQPETLGVGTPPDLPDGDGDLSPDSPSPFPWLATWTAAVSSSAEPLAQEQPARHDEPSAATALMHFLSLSSATESHAGWIPVTLPAGNDAAEPGPVEEQMQADPAAPELPPLPLALMPPVLQQPPVAASSQAEPSDAAAAPVPLPEINRPAQISAENPAATLGFKLPTTSLSNQDRGELLWAADLAVASAATTQPEATAAEPQLPIPSPASRAGSPASAHAGEESTNSGHGNNQGEDAPPPAPESAQSHAVVHTGALVAAEPVSRGALQSVPSAAPPAEPVSPSFQVPMETQARALMPRQVASVQVELAQPGSGEGSMRLVVSQRGENIAVRLRSTGEGMAPSLVSDMQPLLDTLARQGMVERAAAHARAVEPLAVAADLGRAPQAASEASGAQPQHQNQSHSGDNPQRHSQGRGSRQHRRRPSQVFSFPASTGSPARS